MKILKENEYSDVLDIEYLEDSNLKRLSEEDIKSDSILKIQAVSKNGFRFKVHNHCGHIKIGTNSYFVIPKMGKGFLQTMLQAFSRPFLNIYSNELKQDDAQTLFDELIAYLFIGAFERNLSGQIRKGYIQNSISTYKASGKIDVNNSKVFFEYGGLPPTWVKNQWSLNTKYNMAIRSLYLLLAGKLKVSSQTKNKLSKIALEAADKSSEGHIDFRALAHEIDRLHEPYRPIFDLASALNLSSDVSDGSNKTFSLLIPTYSLFEQACKVLLAECMPDYILNTKNEFSISVSAQTNNTLEPDIIIKGINKKVIAVGDCKYAENENMSLIRNHWFQVNAYMDGYGLDRSFILYPSLQYGVENYKLNWGKDISVIKLPTNEFNEFKASLSEVAKYLLQANLDLVA